MKPEDMVIEIDGKTMYRCPLCNKDYKMPHNMVQHIQRDHGYTNSQLQDLYDKLFLNGARPKCKFHDCKNDAKFQTFIRGYRECCNRGHAAGYSNYLKTGNWSTLHNPDVEEKVKKTMNERYAGGIPQKDPKVIEKTKQTCLEKYGVENPNQSDIVKKKIMQTNMERRGVCHSLQDPEVRHKINVINRKKNAEEKYDKFLQFLDYRNYEPLFTIDEYLNCKPLRIKCKICGQTDVIDYPSALGICCVTHDKLTNIEEKVDKILSETKIEYRYRDRQHLGRKEIDFFIPSKNLGIECNGLYFHSSSVLGCDKNYHKDKTDCALNNGIALLQFWESEIQDKTDIVASMIKGKLGIVDKSYRASKLTFTIIDSDLGKTFMNENHIQGAAYGKSTYYGLKNESNELICCAQFGKKRVIYGGQADDNVCELIRFATKLNNNAHGGFSKILKNVIPILKSNGETVIETYCDRRFSPDASKTVYSKTGFKLDSVLEPSYWYYDGTSLKHRYTYTKHSLVQNFSSRIKDIETMTESQITQELGFLKLWDCGQFKFSLKM